MTRSVLVVSIAIVETIGLLLNVFLLVRVICIRNERTLGSYRTCLSIIAMHGIVFAASTLFCIPMPYYTRSFFFKVLNGPIHLLPPSSIIEIGALAVQSTCARLNWLLFPCAFLFQYLALCHSTIRNRTRMLLVYGTSFGIAALSTKSVSFLIPTAETRSMMEAAYRLLVGDVTVHDRVIVFGAATTHRDIKMVIAFSAPMILAIGITSFCVYRITAFLRRNAAHSVITRMADKRQRTVLRMLLRQALALGAFTFPGIIIPIRLFFPPLGPGFEMVDLQIIPLFVAATLYLSPIASASVLLYSMNRISPKRAPHVASDQYRSNFQSNSSLNHSSM